MNPLIQLKITPRLLITLTLLFVCFGLLPNAQAVVPAPDGGYPNFTTAEGTKALQSLTTGSANTAVGWSSLFSNAAGSFNTATGVGTLLFNTADNNTAIGAGALLSNTTGLSNTANGAFALLGNTTGTFNTANGFDALLQNTTGSSNTANGFAALLNDTTGSGNTALGINAGINVTTADNVICIGSNVLGANLSNSCYVGQIFGQPVDPATAVPVFVDTTGKLGTAFSSRRFKHDIKPMDKTSEAILALKPVIFHYKSDVKSTPCFGLVAEDVERVNPNLVVRDKNGELLTVRYDAVNAMLLNEFLKEHRKVEEQEKTIVELKSGMTALAATVKEQAAQIQKVSAQLEASKPAPQVVNNP